MAIEVSIQDGFFKAMPDFLELTKHQMLASGWRAINRSLITLRLESVIQARKVIKLKSGELKSEHIKMLKAKGGSIGSQYGVLSFSPKPIPLLNFVKGSKAPRSQKGIKISRRRPLKYEVIPGRKFRSKSGFIAKVHTIQVFKRGTNGRLYKQSAPSLAHFLYKHGVTHRLAAMAVPLLQENLLRELNYRLEKSRQDRIKILINSMRNVGR